jgi:hypothetical protein
MSLEWVKRRVLVSGGFVFCRLPSPRRIQAWQAPSSNNGFTNRWNILLKNAKYYLHAILFKVICPPVFRNCTTLKGDTACILVVVVVDLEVIGAKAVIDAVVKIVGSWTTLNISAWKDVEVKELMMIQNASGVPLVWGTWGFSF